MIMDEKKKLLLELVNNKFSIEQKVAFFWLDGSVDVAVECCIEDELDEDQIDGMLLELWSFPSIW